MPWSGTMSRLESHPDLVRMMEAGIAGGVFPGGGLLVRVGGKTVHRSFHGRRSLVPPGGPVDEFTCFDLASLTKVLATVPLVLLAIQQGRFGLDDPVARLLEGYAGQGREAVTLRMLLEHSSGLPAWRPFYATVRECEGGAWLATARGREMVRRMAAAEVPEAPPGSRVLYSDLGFILLDWILERVTGLSTDRLFSEWLAGPLGLESLFYVDLTRPAAAAAAREGRVFAATEQCPWRGRTLIGEVHDDNCYAAGGVSGQAGLFGTIQGVAAVAETWLSCWRADGGLFDRRLVREFWTRSQVPGSTRTPGFDTPSPGGSQAGSGFGPRTVGHLGFTGTSLWIDPDRELVVVLLTNRIHPTRQNDAIREFRPRLHTRVAELWR
jgi:CubicO group peptidase (beta-lactamase class C family)